MMKAIKNFMNKPITWGDSFKWSGTFLGAVLTVKAFDRRDTGENVGKLGFCCGRTSSHSPTRWTAG